MTTEREALPPLPEPAGKVSSKIGTTCLFDSTEVRKGDPVYTADEVRRLHARLEKAEGLLRQALPNAEWREKRVYFCGGPAVQNWKLDVYLEIPADSGMNAEQALERALGEQA